jgi:membrane associated rhomboid family serine protease
MTAFIDLKKADKTKVFHTWFFAIAFIIFLWLIKISEVVFDFPLYKFGVYPRTFKGLIGIFTAPLIHGSFSHLFSNSIPLLVLTAGLFYYYKSFGYRIFFLIYVVTGFWVWMSARPSYHIGASGVVYGLAAFLFFSGVFKKNLSLSAFSLVVVFLYGSMIWGVLPLEVSISWESHLMGAIAGIILAYYYRKEGPANTAYQWEKEEQETELPFDEIEVLESNINHSLPPETPVNITYTFKPTNETKL